MFANYLFNAWQRNANESLYKLLIDTSKEFKFEVQTDFNRVELKSIEQKIAFFEKEEAKDVATIRIENMMNEYLTQSFMGGHEKFNQNMVFESDLDQDGFKNKEEEIQEMIKNKIEAVEKPSSS